MDDLEGQVTWSDLGISSGRMYQEPFQAQAEVTQKGQTSKPSSKKSAKLSAKKLPLFLYLKRGGLKPEASAEWVTTEFPFPYLGVSMTVNGGAFHSVENEFAFVPTSTDYLPPTYCLTLNCGEQPREENRTRLSEILEADADPRYRLSARACQGILNRAERRGKELPVELREALQNQCLLRETEAENPTEETDTD